MKAKRNAAAAWLNRAMRAAVHYKAGVLNPRVAPPHPYPESKLRSGSANYLRGMLSGADRYRRAWGSLRKALSHVVLPRRYATGDRRNYRRTLAVCAAAHQWKVGRMTPKQRAKHNPAACFLCKVKVTRRN